MVRRSRYARRLLLAVASTAVALIAIACHPDQAPGRHSRSDDEFGVWNADANGEMRFVATRDVPFVPDQAFGWRVKGGPPERPVKWVETLQLPAPPPSWKGVEESPNVTVSDDGRTATTYGESVPGDEFIGNVWYVSEGDPMGEYQVTVEFEDGRKASVRFRMVLPKDGRSAATGEII